MVKRSMMLRISTAFAAGSLTAIALSGCGGSDSSGVTTQTIPRYVPVALTLSWQKLPADSRAVNVPNAARSAVIRITDLTKANPTENDLVAVAVINRRTDNKGVVYKPAYTQDFKTSGVVARPAVKTFSEVQFWSEPGARGSLVSVLKKSSTLDLTGNLGNFNQASGSSN